MTGNLGPVGPAKNVYIRRFSEGMRRKSYRGKRLPTFPTVLDILIDSQICGHIQLDDTTWVAEVSGLRPTAPSTHETAQEALDAVLRSGWARRLGYQKRGSAIHWSDAATAFVQRGSRRSGAK